MCRSRPEPRRVHDLRVPLLYMTQELYSGAGNRLDLARYGKAGKTSRDYFQAVVRKKI